MRPMEEWYEAERSGIGEERGLPPPDFVGQVLHTISVPDLHVIQEVLADAGKVPDDGDTVLGEVIGRADA